MTAQSPNSQAQTLALKALEWIAAEDDLLHVLLGSTGLDANNLKQNVEDPELLASVLDFLLMDDDWVLGFAQASGATPEQIWRARANLPGGDTPNWT